MNKEFKIKLDKQFDQIKIEIESLIQIIRNEIKIHSTVLEKNNIKRIDLNYKKELIEITAKNHNKLYLFDRNKLKSKELNDILGYLNTLYLNNYNGFRYYLNIQFINLNLYYDEKL